MGGSTKAWQMEVLMERLRSKASGYKSLAESAKGIKQAVLVSISEDYELICVEIVHFFNLLLNFFCLPEQESLFRSNRTTSFRFMS